MDLPARSESIAVAAPPAVVWSAVTDLRAMARRSPELVGMWVLARQRSGGLRAGRVSLNLNRRGLFVWPTLSRIVDHDVPVGDRPGRCAFSVWPTNVGWASEVAADGTGSRLTESRTAVVDPSWTVRATARLALGGQAGHDDELVEGMRTTLAAIAADVQSR